MELTVVFGLLRVVVVPVCVAAFFLSFVCLYHICKGLSLSRGSFEFDGASSASASDLQGARIFGKILSRSEEDFAENGACPCGNRGSLTLHRQIKCAGSRSRRIWQTDGMKERRSAVAATERGGGLKPISGRLLAVAEHGWRKKPGGVGAVPFGEGVGVSPDIVDNIAEGDVAQGSVLYDVGDVAF